MAALSNAKHEAFARNIVQGMNATEAYTAAGYATKTDEAARANASRLLTNANVSDRIAELQERAATGTVTTIESLIEAGWKIVREAAADKQHAAASQTLERIAKIAGLWVDKSEGKNDNTVTVIDAKAASRARESFERVGAAFTIGSAGSGAGTLPH